MIALAGCILATAGAVALQGPTPTVPVPMLFAGEVIALISAGWLLVSVLALGRCFGILPEVRGLVTRGPYRSFATPSISASWESCTGLVIGAPTSGIVLRGGDRRRAGRPDGA